LLTKRGPLLPIWLSKVFSSSFQRHPYCCCKPGTLSCISTHILLFASCNYTFVQEEAFQSQWLPVGAKLMARRKSCYSCSNDLHGDPCRIKLIFAQPNLPQLSLDFSCLLVAAGAREATSSSSSVYLGSSSSCAP
jgi:hypothetical protein